MSSLPDSPPEDGLREKLLRRTRHDLESMRSALDARDYATIVHLAHRLAGAAGAFGFEDLSDAGRALQREGERGDEGAVRARLEQVARELASAAAQGT